MSDSQRSRSVIREKAAKQAQQVHLSRFAGALTASNAVQTKLRDKQLQKLEYKKKMKAVDLFILQRQFFIDKLFDSDNELRFAKIKQRLVEENQANEDPLITEYGEINKTGGGRKEPNNLSCVGKRCSLSDRIFLDKLDDREIAKSANRRKLEQFENRFLLQNSQRAHTASSQTLLDRESTPSLLNANRPSFTPKRNKILSESANVDLSNKGFSGKRVQAGRTNSPVKQSVTFSVDSVDNKWRRQGLAANDNDTYRSSTSSMRSRYTPDTERQFQSQNSIMISSSNVEDFPTDTDLRQEHLLQQLTASLPFHLLTHAQSQIQSMATVLGYHDRNRQLMEKERAKSARPGTTDIRFKRLEASLSANFTSTKSDKYFKGMF